MNSRAEKLQNSKSEAVGKNTSQASMGNELSFQFKDNRPDGITQRKMQNMADDYSANQQLPLQNKEIEFNLLNAGKANNHGLESANTKLLKKDTAQLMKSKYSGTMLNQTIQRMSLIEATTIETGYGLNLNGGQRLRLQDARFTTALYNTLNGNVADLRPLVANFGNLMRLSIFLLNNGTTAQSANALIRVNRFFDIKLLSLHNNRTILQYNTFMGHLEGANGTQKDYFKAFFDERTGTRDPDLFLIDCMDMFANATAIVGTADFFNIIQRAVVNGQAISLNAGNIADTATIYQAFPPWGGFAGFTRWGEGNHGGGAANKLGHFLKHVLSFAEDSTTAEALLWWNTLNINPTFAQLDAAMGERTFTDEENQAIFGAANPGGGATCNGNAGKTYLIEHGIMNYPALTGFFMGQYEDTYGDYVIAQSANLNDAGVHESHDGIFISGRVGDLFIIGRLDANGGALGISSGYYADDIASKLDRQVLWYL